MSTSINQPIPVRQPESQDSRPVPVRWSFTAPHGMRFVNETGSGANLHFFEGQEEEVYFHLFSQLQNHYQAYLAKHHPVVHTTTEIPPPAPTSKPTMVDIAQRIIDEETDK
jgi:hypothetical protein